MTAEAALSTLQAGASSQASKRLAEASQNDTAWGTLAMQATKTNEHKAQMPHCGAWTHETRTYGRCLLRLAPRSHSRQSLAAQTICAFFRRFEAPLP